MENELTTSAKCTEVGLAHWKGWKESSAVSLVFLVFPLIDLMTKVNRVLPRDILQIPKSCKCSNVWPVEKVITLCLPPKSTEQTFSRQPWLLFSLSGRNSRREKTCWCGFSKFLRYREDGWNWRGFRWDDFPDLRVETVLKNKDLVPNFFQFRKPIGRLKLPGWKWTNY